MIRLSQLTLRRGAKALLEGADLTLYAGDRVGLIGANGSGKTSLFALLRGELHADKGDAELPAHWRIAHVAQETPALDRPALEYAIDGQGWQPAYPVDGLLDGRRERVTLRLEAENAGRTLVIRAADALHNVGSTTVVLR